MLTDGEKHSHNFNHKFTFEYFKNLGFAHNSVHKALFQPFTLFLILCGPSNTSGTHNTLFICWYNYKFLNLKKVQTITKNKTTGSNNTVKKKLLLNRFLY